MPAVLWCPGSVTGVRGGSKSGRAAGEKAVQARLRGRAQRCTPGRLWGPALFAQLSGSRSLGQSRVTLALAATTRRNPAVSQCLSARWISFGKILILEINFVSWEELKPSLEPNFCLKSREASLQKFLQIRVWCRSLVSLLPAVKLIQCKGWATNES